MDTVDKMTRSRIMAAVGQADTKPEMALRRALHRLGFRYLVNEKRLPGSPDLVFPKYRAVIFVHGCFWHRHGCKYSTIPKTSRKFWEEKFLANRTRDTRKVSQLRKSGWRIKVVWECELRGDERKAGVFVLKVSRWLVGSEERTRNRFRCIEKGVRTIFVRSTAVLRLDALAKRSLGK